MANSTHVTKMCESSRIPIKAYWTYAWRTGAVSGSAEKMLIVQEVVPGSCNLLQLRYAQVICQEQQDPLRHASSCFIGARLEFTGMTQTSSKMAMMTHVGGVSSQR